MTKIIAAVMVLAGIAGSASASTFTPEIDPASGAAALAIVGGAMLILRARRRA